MSFAEIRYGLAVGRKRSREQKAKIASWTFETVNSFDLSNYQDNKTRSKIYLNDIRSELSHSLKLG